MHADVTLRNRCVLEPVSPRIKPKGDDKPESTPTIEFAKMGFLYIGAMYASNSSLNYVDMVTQVIAKSCKPIPVLVVGTLIMGHTTSMARVLCVVLLCCGVSLFFLMGDERSDSKHRSRETTLFGVAFLAVSLLFDGLSGSYQDRVIKKFNTNTYDLMVYTNLFAVLYVAAGLLVTGEGVLALAFVRAYPAVLVDIAIFSATSAIGQVFIFNALTRVGALLLSVVTTSRKFFTVFLSILWFGHHLSSGQWLGVALVFAGVTIDMLASRGLLPWLAGNSAHAKTS